MLSTSQNESVSVSQRNCVVLCHNTFKNLVFFFLECIFYLLNSFYYFKIQMPSLLYSLPQLLQENTSFLVLSLNPTHGSNNHLHSMETISRLICFFFWNVSSLRASIAIHSFIFQASRTLSDEEHI